MKSDDHDLCVEDLELPEIDLYAFWAVARALGVETEIRVYLEDISNRKATP